MIEFQEWPKIARLNREIVITEKIDGTNAAVIVQRAGEWQRAGEVTADGVGFTVEGQDGEAYTVGAQSRKRVISPGKSTDNYGFAGWVREHAQELADGLGEGYHYGEWCGLGIQRGYDLAEKRFALFNVHRWTEERPSCCDVVPVLYSGLFNQIAIDNSLAWLKSYGSRYSPGFMRPEGIIIYHTAARTYFKVTCEKDAEYKGNRR